MTVHQTVFQKMRRVIVSSKCLGSVNSLLVGVSGGADSSVLLHQLCALRRLGGPKPIAVHIHHGTRGEEADYDAELAEKTARDHQCEFHVIRLSHKNGTVPEHCLRNSRLTALEDLAKKLEVQRIALAHHLDDQAETVLLRLLGGTDIKGLGAIRVFRPPFWIRPLLGVSKKEILKEAEFCKIPFAKDSTNEHTHIRRNFLRKNVIPLLQSQINPQINEHLARLAESMSEVNDYMEDQAEQLLSESCSNSGGFKVSKLRTASQALRNVALQKAYRKKAGEGAAMRRAQLRAVNRLIETEGNIRTYRLPKNILAVRYANQIDFKRYD